MIVFIVCLSEVNQYSYWKYLELRFDHYLNILHF